MRLFFTNFIFQPQSIATCHSHQIGVKPFYEKRKFTGILLSFKAGLLLVLCVLLLYGTQMPQLSAQFSPGITWDNSIYSVEGPSSGYAYNVTAYGLYNGTYFNLFCPLNYTGNLPLVIQFGGYLGITNGTGNLNEESPLCHYLACKGYAVLEFGYDTGGTIPEASQTCLEVLDGTILPWIESGSFPLSIDKSRIALCGHSAGGSATLGLASPSVASSIALTPYYLSTSRVPAIKNSVPTLILTGQDDAWVPYTDNGTSYYNGLVASRAILDIAGADHNLGVGNSDFNTAGTAPTLKFITAWLDATLKGNSTAARLFTSSYLSGDSEVNIFQLDITTLSPSPSESGNNQGGKSDNGAVITCGIIIVASLSIIVGFTIYRTRKRRPNVNSIAFWPVVQVATSLARAYRLFFVTL